MRSLVTGGAGFIGSHLVERLLFEGDDVFVLDNLSTGSLHNLDGIHSDKLLLEKASVEDAANTESVVRRFRPDRIFHLAAQVSVPLSAQAPVSDFQTNALGAAVLFEAAARYRVSRIVFSSTGGAIYGEAEDVPTSEDYPALPQSPYGQHKLLAEISADFYGRQHKMDIVVLRFANVFGPRQGGSGESGVISLFTEAAASKKPVTIYGDGKQTRDFVFVGDVVEALLRASQEASGGAVFNVGTSKETSINELVTLLGGMGLPIEARYANGRDEEVIRSALDYEKAKDGLDWQPKTDLQEGLRRTVQSVIGKPRRQGPEKVLCADVGGKTISFAEVREGAPVVAEEVAAPSDPKELFDILAERATEKWALALPGTVSGRRYWSGSAAYSLMDSVVDLQKEFSSRKVSAPMVAENDVYAFARGAAIENLRIPRLATINLGWGVGGSLAVQGWPERGVAQEIGHIALPGNDLVCACGQRGCVSTRLAFGELHNRLGIEKPADLIRYPEAMLSARQALSFLLQTMTLALAPGAIAIGGGAFWGLWEQELDSLREEVNQQALVQTTLLPLPGPEVALKGLFDLLSWGEI